jgi:hypothetical protein
LKVITFAVFLAAAAVSGGAAPAVSLFPKPLHLIKRIDDPLAKSSRVVDEYCYGDRIVAVSGARVSIIDYAAQTVTEIDHGHGTYSITRFDEIANARPKAAAVTAKSGNALGAPAVTATVKPAGVKSSAGGRSVDSFEIEAPHTKVVVGLDRSVTLSRAAVEALIGASYPNVRRPEHDAILGVASPARTGRIAANSSSTDDAADYALPSEQAITITSDGGSVTLKTSVLRFDSEQAPQSATLLDPGATRVESPIARFAREMREADTIPVAPRP